MSREAEAFNSPSTFSTYAKMHREVFLYFCSLSILLTSCKKDWPQESCTRRAARGIDRENYRILDITLYSCWKHSEGMGALRNRNRCWYTTLQALVVLFATIIWWGTHIYVYPQPLFYPLAGLHAAAWIFICFRVFDRLAPLISNWTAFVFVIWEWTKWDFLLECIFCSRTGVPMTTTQRPHGAPKHKLIWRNLNTWQLVSFGWWRSRYRSKRRWEKTRSDAAVLLKQHVERRARIWLEFKLAFRIRQ